MANNALFVLYDGIKNSVFQSQVLAPILNELDACEDLNIKIISFEKDVPSAKNFSTALQNHKRLEFVFFKRVPFFGTLSMRPAIHRLKKELQHSLPDKIIARGPLAGYVVLKGLSNMINIDTLVQARGLCSQEYRYSTQKIRRLFKKIWNRFIFGGMEKIEQYVYSSNRIKIESVSQALKDYLVQHFGAEQARIIIAVKDIPKTVDKYQAVVWRSQTRGELSIPEEAVVYCYSGSYRPWQCAGETIESFAFEYFKDPQIFMLVLTQDIEPFKMELQRFKIPDSNYRILTVSPQDLYKYMCAANFGFLLRDADIINWVSRPTKMLEYQACGLKIVHNNTVEWLAKKDD